MYSYLVVLLLSLQFPGWVYRYVLYVKEMLLQLVPASLPHHPHHLQGLLVQGGLLGLVSPLYLADLPPTCLTAR